MTWWEWSFSSFVFIYQGSLLFIYFFITKQNSCPPPRHSIYLQSARKIFFLCFSVMATHNCPWGKHQSYSRDVSTEITEKSPHPMLIRVHPASCSTATKKSWHVRFKYHLRSVGSEATTVVTMLRNVARRSSSSQLLFRARGGDRTGKVPINVCGVQIPL